MSAKEAQAAGALFYSLPEDLTDEMIDPLLRKAVRRINESGWCWTAESCQGHPDSFEHHPWAGNTRPFLRLVCIQSRAGEMLYKLMQALRYDDFGMPAILVAELFPWTTSFEGYEQFMVYIRASSAYERNLGIAAFERFAESLHGASSQAEQLLKPCPFCGANDAHIGSAHACECGNCLSQGPYSVLGDESTAIELWNRRAADQANEQ